MARAQNIKVQPESIKAYGRKAQAHFNDVRKDLQIIVNTVERAPYEGTNAKMFKDTCMEMASEFSTTMLADMQTIADAVRITTTNIAQALGGQPITIKVDGTKITPQKVAKSKDGSESIDTIAMRSMPRIMETRFDNITSELRGHLRALEATVWEGQGKKTAVEQVGQFTKSVSKRVDDNKRAIVKYINDQLDAVIAADK